MCTEEPERCFLKKEGVVAQVEIVNIPSAWNRTSSTSTTTYPASGFIQEINGAVRIIPDAGLLTDEHIEIALIMRGRPATVENGCSYTAPGIYRLEKYLGSFVIEPQQPLSIAFTISRSDVEQALSPLHLDSISNPISPSGLYAWVDIDYLEALVFVEGTYRPYELQRQPRDTFLSNGYLRDLKDWAFSPVAHIPLDFGASLLSPKPGATIEADISASSSCPRRSDYPLISISNIALHFRGFSYINDSPRFYTRASPTALTIDSTSTWGQLLWQNQDQWHVIFAPDGRPPARIPSPAGTYSYPYPYCAIEPHEISLYYSVSYHNIPTAMTRVQIPIDLPFSRGLILNSGEPSCPTTIADGCQVDPNLAFAEECYKPLRAGAFCLSGYENDYLESHGFCDDAYTFIGAMNALWMTPPSWMIPSKDVFARDWINLNKPASVLEFIGSKDRQGNSVDILFIVTHGGVTPTDARLSLWPTNEEILTNSDNIRLGDISGRLSVLVLSSCWVLSDNQVDFGDSSVDPDTYNESSNQPPVQSGVMFNRWANVLRGGLRIAVGGAEGPTMSDGWLSSTDDNPRIFVEYMENRPVLNAFIDAWQNWDVEQHVGGIASGRNANECLDRLENMTLKSINAYPRLYDNDVIYLCQDHVFHD